MSAANSKLLSVLSRLIDYPSQAIFDNKAAVLEIVNNAGIPHELRDRLSAYLNTYLDRDLMDCQAEYDGLFERGRSLGLWLFEHVHGESRDRGQAMVDLIAQYREAGLEISQHELPDYIPLFLEFLATQGDDNAKSWLIDVENIIAMLQCRLENRKSGSAILFETLMTFSGSTLSLEDVHKNISGEKRDDTNKAIDKEWEEEQVTFGQDSLDKSCESAKRRPNESQRKDLDAPMHWVGFNDATPPAPNDTSKGVAK